MITKRASIWKTLDWFTVLLYLIMVFAGWLSIYAASYDFDYVGLLNFSGRSGSQMIWILTSIALGFVIVMIDKNWFDIFAYWLYALMILLLIATIFLASDVRGSRSWLELGPVRLQPAEFAKFATALALAKMMSGYHFQLLEGRNFMKVLGLILVPMLMIILQKETGSALVFLAFFLVLFREGMSGVVLISGFCAVLFFVLAVKYSETIWGVTQVGEYSVFLFILLFVVGFLYNYKMGKSKARQILYVSLPVLAVSLLVNVFFPFNQAWVALALIVASVFYLLFTYLKYRAKAYLFIALFAMVSVGFMYSIDYVFDNVLEPHQRIRIQVTLGVLDDPRGAGYNVNQSKIAIGSGGVFGKGFLKGTQTKLKYVPEQDTDFIFCTVGEEEGFAGTTAVLALFVVLILRLIHLAERQKSIFNRVYGYSVASIFFFHVAVNVGMVIGITPVIGIPLPFFSYGGSSLWAFTILLFIFLRLDAGRKEVF